MPRRFFDTIISNASHYIILLFHSTKLYHIEYFKNLYVYWILHISGFEIETANFNEDKRWIKLRN